MAVGMPGEDRLRPGPQRELTLAIHTLYEGAGMPGTRTISSAIRKRSDLPDTVSHEAVRGILLGARSRWSKVASLVLQLITWSVISLDPALTLKRIHELWLAAERPVGSAALGRSSPANQEKTIPDGSLIVVTEPDDISPAPGATEQAQELDRKTVELLIRWESRMGTVEIFDRQMAIRMLRDMRQRDE